LFFTAASEFLGLEGAFGLELSAPVLRDVTFSHDCDATAVIVVYCKGVDL
jgi:hypothetical protein